MAHWVNRSKIFHRSYTQIYFTLKYYIFMHNTGRLKSYAQHVQQVNPEGKLDRITDRCSTVEYISLKTC